MADNFSLLSFSTGTAPDRASTPSTWHDGDTDEYEWVRLQGDDKSIAASAIEPDTYSVRRGDDSFSDTSASVSINRYENDHGRRYHGYKSGRYPLPNDTQQQNLEDLQHLVMMELTEGRPFLANIEADPEKVMDIGTGTGVWAVDMADLYPDCSVAGTDLSPIQPSSLPLNCQMFIDDCEADWAHDSDYDLIHLRNVAGVLRDLDAMVDKAQANLKPGGWIEFQDLHVPEICCDDASMPASDPVRTFFQLSAEGMRRLGCTGFGCSSQNDDVVRASLQRAGFTNVRCVTKKIPITPWARDEQLKYLGGLMRVVVEESLGAFAAKPLAAMGMGLAERKMMMAEVRAGLNEKGVHRYVKVQYCYGQKVDALE